MSEKKFVVETVEITDCDTDVSRIVKVITDTKETYSYEDVYEVAELLNRLSEENEQLKKECKIAIDEMVTDYKKLEGENEQLQKELEKVKLLNESLGSEEPVYYNFNGLSPNQAFEQGLISNEEFIGFIKGNVIKYVVRCGKKGDPIDDINKAISYLQLLKKIMSV